jgi:hypothetical protein
VLGFDKWVYEAFAFNYLRSVPLAKKGGPRSVCDWLTTAEKRRAGIIVRWLSRKKGMHNVSLTEL